MLSTIIGTKKEMSLRFDERGHRAAVSIVKIEPNTIFVTKDSRVQLTFGQKKKPKKPESLYVTAIGHSPKFIHQIRINDQEKSQIKTGDKIAVSVFEPKDLVKVTGITKGKGFAGGIKRWGFHGGPKTHGQSDRHRAPGSIGQTTTPGRVFKGKHMAGHMGVEKLTVTNLEVIEVDANNNLLVIKGAVPGGKNGILIIEKTGKAKSYTPPPPPSETKAEEAKETPKAEGPERSRRAEEKLEEREEKEAEAKAKEGQEGKEGTEETKAAETSAKPSQPSEPAKEEPKALSEVEGEKK